MKYKIGDKIITHCGCQVHRQDRLCVSGAKCPRIGITGIIEEINNFLGIRYYRVKYNDGCCTKITDDMIDCKIIKTFGIVKFAKEYYK